MYKHLGKIFRISFFVFLIALVAGIHFYVTGQTNYYHQSLIIGTFASIIIVSSAIYEIVSSNNVSFTKKLLWSLFLISFNTLAGAVYLLFARRKIRSEY